MKPAGIVGIILIIIGIVALAYGGFTYTKREKVLDLGPIQATAEREHTVPFPPILGGICLVGGILLVVVGGRSSSAETRILLAARFIAWRRLL